MKYTAVVERVRSRKHTSYSAYLPDVPGCIATGKTREEVERIRGALAMHLASLAGDDLPFPEPGAWTITLDVDKEALQPAPAELRA